MFSAKLKCLGKCLGRLGKCLTTSRRGEVNVWLVFVFVSDDGPIPHLVELPTVGHNPELGPNPGEPGH